MPSLDYAPNSLGDIDTVEVVMLYGIRGNRVGDEMDAATAAPRAILTGSEAQEVATLWRRLPLARQDRCHVPPYGLRFLQAGEHVVEASICWECNNAFGKANGQPIHFTFDSQSEAAQALLARLLVILPLPPER